jgi:hypothetical protein
MFVSSLFSVSFCFTCLWTYISIENFEVKPFLLGFGQLFGKYLRVVPGILRGGATAPLPAVFRLRPRMRGLAAAPRKPGRPVFPRISGGFLVDIVIH